MLTPQQLQPLYDKYTKEKVDEALDFLTYRHADELPKADENKAKGPIIYIFRHGQSTDNAEFLFSGWREAHITEDGMKQALVLAPKLQDKKIDMLISSTQVRAYDTMKIAVCLNEKARTLKIETDKRIMERSYGDWQGTSKLVAHLENPEALMSIRRDYDHAPPNGENLSTVCKRVAEFCNEILPLMRHTKVNVAISCHGNSIRGFRQYFEKLDNETTSLIETPLGQDYASYAID